MMSSGSPSSPLVEGKKPKSNGKLCPIGIALSNINKPCSSSYLNFVRLPFGVSIIALTYCDFGPNGRICEMSRTATMDYGSPVKSSSKKVKVQQSLKLP